jgi:hypothetical protein
MSVQQAPVPSETPSTAAVQPPAPSPTTTGVAPAAVSEAELMAMEERIMARMDASLQQYATELERQRAAEQARTRIAEREREPAQRVVVAVEPAIERGGLDPELGFPRREIRAYSGLGFRDDTQFMMGVAADFGPVSTGSSFRLLPEFALGLGGPETSWMAAANLQYRIPWVLERDRFWINPLVSVGAGLLHEGNLEAVLNAMYGVNFQIKRANRSSFNLFAAHQGIQFFDRDRILFGVSLGR